MLITLECSLIAADTERCSARFFEKQCNGMVPIKDMCVSFILEEGEKGPSAKDVREEDPQRIAGLTAKVHYGKVVVRKSLCLVLFTHVTPLTSSRNTAIRQTSDLLMAMASLSVLETTLGQSEPCAFN